MALAEKAQNRLCDLLPNAGSRSRRLQHERRAGHTAVYSHEVQARRVGAPDVIFVVMKDGHDSKSENLPVFLRGAVLKHKESYLVVVHSPDPR
jgi:hypothetical protein